MQYSGLCFSPNSFLIGAKTTTKVYFAHFAFFRRFVTTFQSNAVCFVIFDATWLFYIRTYFSWLIANFDYFHNFSDLSGNLMA